ncbi:MAG: hypothetical protein M1814_005085 [Vezdaea aestivalis]|nr:MAG: hypothetical protein M1814_005085 [Vezdaea aestivalis]
MATSSPLKYETGQIWSSKRNIDVQLKRFLGTKCFQVDLFTNFKANPKLMKEYLHHIKASAPDYLPPLNDGELTHLMEDFYEWAMEPFLPIFRQIQPLEPMTIKGQLDTFFKFTLPGDIGSTLKELSAYIKIHAAGLGADVRSSQLLSIVEDESTSRIVGLLLSYIECNNTTLRCAERGPENTLLRQKWIWQVTHTLRQLHSHGVVWGDAKSDKTLIDKHDDAYLVNSGGGYTKGWVNEKLSNTIE